ncbi:choline/glycine/proline betaine transport protein [Isoptericola sp. CG 20/1183]|uniref:Choline/glycine/proline betaine transport protein n=1 Tax=Isoptericola halotolerans TaxID=300560 RepID=A0ABX5EF32_9MICO|nr:MULTISPECIES: BCCT family transporter [Isoptericola]PRZ07760.1 choline/glycine/proline betaine transport protein [Isoptericola halotolerans]PRZ07881.1 choline/glycine/proline betaine transport protein [Isoptericola sp. CG 20/1183]
MTRRRSTIAPAVFYPAGGLILLFVLLAFFATDTVKEVMNTLQAKTINGFGWYYVVIVAAFMIFAIWMGVSRFGEITLGPDDEPADFRLPVWFAMLFATGMGIGLVYYGVAEPLSHFESPKPGVTGDAPALAQAAMGQTYVHWGFHAWGIYVVIGLALAYAIHRKGRPASIRWALEPLLGQERVKGRLGDVIDVLAIFGTVFGVATSLGLGVQQVAAGLDYLEVADATLALQMGLIAAITAVAAVSVASGLERGIKWLSNGNMLLAAALVLAVLIMGSTLFVAREWVQSIGYYLQNVMFMTFDTLAFQGEDGLAWESGWTIFYWGWWMSWAPFVGLFIARISRGRTVREFVLGTLLVPMLVTTVWFSVFGGSAIHQERNDPGSMLAPDPETGEMVVNTDTAMFQLFESLPGGGAWMAVVAIVLVVVFFVTSSDSGSFVVDMLANGGDPNPPLWSRLFWAILEGGVAAALLYAGGLSALQTAAILTALPFSVVMIGSAISVWKALDAEYRQITRAERRLRRRELTEHVTEHVTDHVTENFAEISQQSRTNGTRRSRWRRSTSG